MIETAALQSIAHAAPWVVPTVAGIALLALGGMAFRGRLRSEPAAFDRDGSIPEPSDRSSEGAEAERFRQLVVQVEGFAIFMLDADGRNRTWNEGVERLVGYREAEWIGQPIVNLFTPEDRAKGDPARELREAAERGQSSDDRWLMRKDGSRFFATGITTALRDRSGRLIGYSKVFRDRTEERKAGAALEESETRLRVALEAARMGIWRFHIPTGTLRIDASMAPLLGLGAGERSESLERFLSNVHPDDRDRVGEAFRQSAGAGENMDLEFRAMWPDGTIRWLSDHGRIVRGADGAPEFLTGAATDVTERREAEARLVQAQRMDAVGQLAGGVAHEVNNMMQAVMGYTALLLASLGRREKDKADLLQIHRAAERAATITRQLLAFSRRQVIQPETLDLNRVVREMEPIVRRTLGEDRELRLEPADRLPLIRADRGSLEQVVLNLVLNARDATQQGGTLALVTRDVTLTGSESRRRPGEPAPGRYAALSLTDTGMGMDEETRAHAFEPFFTTKPVGQGTGLGLAVVQGIVEQSGGTIRLVSAPGQGTTVELYFPAVAAPQETPAVEPVPSLPGGTGSVLVVEDEPIVRDFVCRLLRQLGYTCMPVAGGAEALELVHSWSEPPDLVLTDLVMPGMSGRKLAQHLAADCPGLPILYTSGYSADEVVRRGLLPPRASYLQKPFTLETLATSVRALLERPTD